MKDPNGRYVLAMDQRLFSYLAKLFILFIAYFASARLGLQLDAINGFAALVWPPTGLALGVMLISGYKLWPAIALGALLANLMAGAPFILACIIALGNTCEALLGVYILKRKNFHLDLSRLKDTINLIFFAALLCSMLSASIGTFSLWISQNISVATLHDTWKAWWVGDALGSLIIAPLILVWYSRRKPYLPAAIKSRPLETFAFVMALISVCLTFLKPLPIFTLSAVDLPYLVFPLMIWSALRFGVRGAVTTTFILSMTAVIATVNSTGPFARETLIEGLKLLHLFIGTVATAALVLASTLAEHVPADLFTKESKERKSTENLYHLLVEAAQDYAIIMLDTAGYIASWNSGAEKTTGYKAIEIIGKHFSIFYPDSDINPCSPDQELSIAKTDGRFEGEGWRVRKDGSRFFASIVVAPIYSSEGHLQGFSKITKDVTNRKTIENDLRKLNDDLEQRIERHTREVHRRERQLRIITDALPVFVAELDTAARFLFLNEAYLDWLNVTMDYAVNRQIIEIVGEEKYKKIEPYIAEVLRGNKVTFEHTSIRSEKKIFFSVTFIPEFDEQTQISGFILVASDITKHIEAKEVAEAANKAKSSFLANMSHEIRTPLGVILGFSELLISPHLSSTEKSKYIAAIQRNGDLLSSIISDILDLSKIEAGKIEIETQRVSLAEVLTDLTTMLNLKAQEKGLTLIVTSSGPIPYYIQIDVLRLRQILINIVGNAIKFTEKGTVEVKISFIDNNSAQKKLIFDVIDTGPGIEPNEARKLFEPFIQGDASAKRRFGGTGLGLVLSRRLANMLGGDVFLKESAPSKGSTFTIAIDPGMAELDLAEEFAPSTQELSSKPSSADQIRLDHIKVLLVEDALDNQILVSRYLEKAGANVETANNGKEAIEKSHTGNYDILLMDLQMPIMDGYEATAILRKTGYHKPIIALTAHALKEERLHCLDSGFDDHISKPINRSILLERIAFRCSKAPQIPFS